MRARPAAGSRPPFDTHQRTVLTILALIGFCTVYSTLAMAPILLQVAKEFDVTISQAGLATTAYGLPAAVVAVAAGPYSDRHGRKGFLVAGVLVLGLGAVANALAPSFWILVAGRFVAGIGAGCCLSSGQAAVGDTFAYHQRGRALGAIVAATAVATVIGVPVGGVLADHTSWRVSLGVLGAVATSIGVVAHRSLPRGEGSPSASPVRALYAIVLRQRAARLLLVVAFLATVPWASWSAYTVVFFQVRFGLGQGTAALLALTSGVGLLVGSQIGGRLGDSLGHRRVFVPALGASAAALLAVTNVSAGPTTAAALNVAVAALAGGRIITHASLISEQAPSARATLMSMLSSVNYTGNAAGAALGGVFIDVWGFWLLGILCCAMTAAAWIATVANHHRLREPPRWPGDTLRWSPRSP